MYASIAIYAGDLYVLVSALMIISFIQEEFMSALIRLFCVLLLAAWAGCKNNNIPVEAPGSGEFPLSHTFILSSPNDPRLPSPLTEHTSLSASEHAFVKFAATRTVQLDDSLDPSEYWNLLTTELANKAKLPPPKYARAYALVHAAMYDALLSSHGTRRRDLLSRTVAAGAAAKVLTYLFPDDEALINERAASQIGTAHGSALGRIQRSWALGTAVGSLAVEYGKSDGSSAVFTGTPPTGDGIWTGTNPVLPMAGTWKTWVLTSGSEFQPEPPYPYGSHEDSVDVDEVYQVSLVRTTEQIAIVHKWADVSPPAIWNGHLGDRTSVNVHPLASARAYAYLNVAMYDAFVACWQCKYTFWTARPIQRIAGLVTVIPTPNFPSYTSGHSTISAAAGKVLGELFPAEASFFAGEAEEAAASRLYGGIHFRHDNDQGAEVGLKIGDKVISVMRQDAPLPLMASN